jgi:hypothetical protein
MNAKENKNTRRASEIDSKRTGGTRAPRGAHRTVATTRQEMTYMETRKALGTVAFFIGYLATFPVHATFHIVEIQEVVAGADGNPAIQFIELTMLRPNENCQQSGDIDPEGPFGCVDGSGFPDFSAARLFFFDV